MMWVRRKTPSAAAWVAGVLLALCVVQGAAGAQSEQSYVIRNATVVPVTSPRLSNASVVIQNGRIAAVGTNVQVPSGATIIDATGLYVYPGLINAGTQLGLIEVGGVPGPDDTRELGDFNPQNVTMTAVNAGSAHIGVTRANGITTALTAAGGSVMSGIAALINLAGYTNEEMVAKERAALLLSWPSLAGGGGRGGGGGRFGGFGQAGSEAEQRAEYERRVHQIYTWFGEAKAYNETKARLTASGGQLPSSFRTNLKYEAMAPALRGEMPVLVDANTVDQMRDAIRFADSMKVRIIIRGARDGWRYADTLAAKRIPVIVGPVTTVPGNDDPYDLIYANPGVMAKAGVLLAFQSGGASSARDLPYEVGLAIAYGLDPEEGLKSITINPARIFGVDNEYGSIEVGKWANVIVTTGDPIDIRSSIKEIFVKGRRMAFDDHHTRLYELYRARPKPPATKPPR
ncbi:MAG TPA: amidohydrolase family protein [Gemmatimonadaceae bacterium]|nr:amidohydrolase family protein [Gemmatimonadaceae bacterium]